MVKAIEQYAKRVLQESEDSRTLETEWHVFGAADEIAARAALASAAPSGYVFPATSAVGYLRNISIKDVYESSDENFLTHQATLTYSAKEPKKVDDIDYAFDTAGVQEQLTLTHALSTTPVTANGRKVPDFFGASIPHRMGPSKALRSMKRILLLS